MSSYYNFTGETINMNNVEETISHQQNNNNEISSPDSQKVCKITKPLSSFLEAIKFNCCGYYSQAQSNLEQALENLEKEKDLEQNNSYLLLKILIELSKANLGLGKYKEAEEHLIQGQEKLQRSKTVTMQERELFCAEIEAYFGCVDMEKHLFEDAFKRFSKALLIFQKSKAEKTCQRVMCYRRVGEIFLEQKLYGDALEYLNIGINFLTDREDLDNEEFIELMRTLNRKGLLYLNLQRYKEAKDIFFENSKAIRSRFGEEHIELAWIYQNLSTMYSRLCQYKEANKMLESAIAIQIRLFGEKYPGVAKAYLEKGRLLLDQEKVEEGELYIKKGFELASTIYNENEPAIGAYYLKLGYFYLEQEKCAKAEEYFKQLLLVYTKAYGEDNVLTSIAYHALAITYQEMGNEKEAQRNYQKDLELCRKNYGEYHPEVSKSYYWLGILEWMNDRHDIAIDYFEKCIEMNKKFYGETSPQLATDYQELARVSIDCGRINEAIEYYDKGNKIEQAYFGKEHPRLVRSYFLTGIGLCDAGKYDEAIFVLEKALAIAGVSGDLQLRRIYHAIGNVYNNQAEYGKALRFYGMALDVWKENGKNEELLRNIGDVFYNQDKFEKALNVYKKALLTAVKNKGYKHYAVGILHTNIGNCLGWMRNEELEALKSLQKGIKILLQVPHKDQVVLLDNFYSRGDVMMRTKGPREGLAAMKKAIMVCRMSEKGKVNEVDKRIKDFEIRKALNDKNIL